MGAFFWHDLRRLWLKMLKGPTMQIPPNPTPQQIAHAGVHLYGDRWQTAMARDLGCTPQAIRAWFSPTRPSRPSRSIVRAIQLLLEKHESAASIFG